MYLNALLSDDSQFMWLPYEIIEYLKKYIMVVDLQ